MGGAPATGSDVHLKHAGRSGTGPYKDAEKRAAIIAAAGQLFAQQGLRATSMEMVAKRAGVAKQTVYSHFKNKDALYAAVIPTKLQQVGVRADALDWSLGAEDILRRFALAYMGMIGDPEVVALSRLVMSEAAEYPQVAEQFFNHGNLRGLGLIADFLRDMNAHGLLPTLDYDSAALDLRNLWLGNFRERLLFNLDQSIAETELDAHLRRVNAVFLRAYGGEVHAG